MPYEVENGQQRQLIRITVTKLVLDFENKNTVLSCMFEYSDNFSEIKEIIFSQDDFLEFYANYATHQYLYDVASQKFSLSGYFNNEAEPQ